MKLNFEVINTYTDGELLDFTHEPDNLFTKYYKKGKHVLNESVKPYRGDFERNKLLDVLDYHNLIFENEPNRLTTEAISKFGVKNFPQFGSYGFFTSLYSGKTKVLAPINKERSTYAHPRVFATQDEHNVRVAITDPQSVTYDCYRIMFRQDLFASEFITYEREFTLPKMIPGDYELSVIGYKEGGIISVETDPRRYRIPDVSVRSYASPHVLNGKTVEAKVQAVAGDLALAFVAYKNTFTAPAGWTLVTTAAQGAQKLNVYKQRILASGETSFLATQSSDADMQVTLVSLLNAGDPAAVVDLAKTATREIVFDKTIDNYTIYSFITEKSLSKAPAIKPRNLDSLEYDKHILCTFIDDQAPLTRSIEHEQEDGILSMIGIRIPMA